jgi:hypothetical protein
MRWRGVDIATRRVRTGQRDKAECRKRGWGKASLQRQSIVMNRDPLGRASTLPINECRWRPQRPEGEEDDWKSDPEVTRTVCTPLRGAKGRSGPGFCSVHNCFVHMGSAAWSFPPRRIIDIFISLFPAPPPLLYNQNILYFLHLLHLSTFLPLAHFSPTPLFSPHSYFLLYSTLLLFILSFGSLDPWNGLFLNAVDFGPFIKDPPGLHSSISLDRVGFTLSPLYHVSGYASNSSALSNTPLLCSRGPFRIHLGQPAGADRHSGRRCIRSRLHSRRHTHQHSLCRQGPQQGRAGPAATEVPAA